MLRWLTGERPVVLFGRTVSGTLDLTDIGVVRAPFDCRSCRFVGGIRAAHTVFARDVDLTGAQISRCADFRAARFEQSLVLGPEGTRNTSLSSFADFRLATFDDLADFDGVRFKRQALFTLARFRGDASFSSARFDQLAMFDGVAFSRLARFYDAQLHNSNFSSSTFAVLGNFRVTRFGGRTLFIDSTFQSTADFAQSVFTGQALFDRARFASGASFLAALFANGSPSGSVSFNHALAHKTLDLSGVTLDGDADLEGLETDALSLDPVFIAPGVALKTAGLSSSDLSYPLASLGSLTDPGEQERVATLIEESAKNHGDLGLANDAHYEARLLAARGESWPVYLLDFVFYRGIAGYFVRPFRPLLILVTAAIVVALILQVRRKRPPSPVRWSAISWIRDFTITLLDRFALIVPRLSGRDQAESPSLGVRLEAITYRVLLACALIGFAASNPTLREMLNSLL